MRILKHTPQGMRLIVVLAICLPLVTIAQVKPDTTTRPAAVHSSKVNPVPGEYYSNIKLNAVRVWEPSKPISNDSLVIDSNRTVGEVKQSTQYFDGLGRPIQSVAKQVSPSGKDMVSPIVYDAFGRVMFNYLPYVQVTGNTNDGKFKGDPFAAQASFYANATYNPGAVGEQVYYSRTNFENSPLMRSDSNFAPGNSWGGSHVGVAVKYTVNKAADSVRIWNISMAIGSSPSTSAVYTAGALYKTVTTDEHGKQVIEYKDLQGQIILKKVQLASSPSTHHTGWLCTYYVYDDFGNLRFVIPPKGVEAIAGAGLWSIGSTVRDELCFRYEYDGRKRMIIKKVPGAGEVHMVYDARDRLIMTQDANLNGNTQWMVTKYDALNRPVQTYIWTNSSNRSYHEAEADSSTNYPTLSGTYELLTETYFDDYSWVSGSGSGLSSSLITTYTSNTDYFYTASNSTSPYPQSVTATNCTWGMATGSKVNVLGTSTYLYTTSFYDDRGRVIQTHGTNNSGGKDTATMQYDFSGKVLRSLLCHAKSGTNAQRHIMLTKSEYDDAGRMITIKKKTNNSPEVTIAENSYDELGQLKQKKLGRKRDESSQNTYTSTPIDSLAYSYNIRGWLRGINKDYARGTGNDHWFGMELTYDVGFSQDQLNGNIAGIRWKSNGSDEQRSYGFSYDAVNRLMKADFTQYSGGNWNISAGIDLSMKMGDGSDPTTAYDANGNILGMWQKGLKISASATIDSLSYAYQSNSNKLAEVTDGITADNKLGDFKDVNTTYDDYSYDNNGNMNYDRNKDISNIIYNHLNLPDSIRILGKGTIKYTYDASGNKLKKKTVDSTGSSVKTVITSYLGGFVYQNDTLQYAAHEEGRIREKRVNGQDTMYYDYFIKDHLGNIRMMLTDEIKNDEYMATNETANQSFEQLLFSNYTHIVNKPSGFGGGGNEKVQRLGTIKTGGTQVLGEGIVLKVMAGDRLEISAYGMSGSDGSWDDPDWEELLTTFFTNGILQTGGGKGGSSFSDLSAIISPAMAHFLYDVEHHASEMNGFLNWVFLDDEQLNYDEDMSGMVELSSSSTSGRVLLQANGGEDIEIRKNGYIYIYLSNMSETNAVFFDDLHVRHTRGPLLEETHYYPFGLTMAGISSKAASFGGNENKRKFNDGTELENKEFSDDSGLELYATDFRSYDAQIGRFYQIDPLSEIDYSASPYVYANNNPILINDPLGLKGDSIYNSTTPLPEVVVTNDPKPNNNQISPPGIVNVSTSNINLTPLIPTISPYGDNALIEPPLWLPLLTNPKIIPQGNPLIQFQTTPKSGGWGSAFGRVFGTATATIWPSDAVRTNGYIYPKEFKPYVGHGNRRENSNPHIVYQFTFTPTDSNTPVLKYGISDYYRYAMNRPEGQLAAMIAKWGPTVKLAILHRTLTREQALSIEQNLVTAHNQTWGRMPREQSRPTPQ